MDTLYGELITIQSKLPDGDEIWWASIAAFNEALDAAQSRTGRNLIEFFITRDALRSHRVEPMAQVDYFCTRAMFEAYLERAIEYCRSSP